MMLPDYSQKFSECKELKGKGYYGEAAKGFKQLLETLSVKDEDNVVHLADTLLMQGYYESALEHLEAYLRPNGKPRTQADSTLQMMRAFARAHVKGAFKEGLALAQHSQLDDLSADEVDGTDHRVSSSTYLATFKNTLTRHLGYSRAISLQTLALCVQVGSCRVYRHLLFESGRSHIYIPHNDETRQICERWQSGQSLFLQLQALYR